MPSETVMTPITLNRKCLAIVMFGPASPTSGFRAAEYYQVTIDPEMVSPSGDYIRFGNYLADEINGWQRIEALTVVEVLTEEIDGDLSTDLPKRDQPITMRALDV